MTKKLIFTYGTLQHKEVQNKILKRNLKLEKATLEGYELFSDETPYLYVDENPESKVEGFVFSIDEEELFRIDAWEDVPVYERKLAKVKVGSKIEEAYFYTKGPIGSFDICTNSEKGLSESVKNELASINSTTFDTVCDLTVMQPFLIDDEEAFYKVFENQSELEKRFGDNLKASNTYLLEEQKILELHDYLNYETTLSKRAKIVFEINGIKEVHTVFLTFKFFENPRVLSFDKKTAVCYFHFINLTTNLKDLVIAIKGGNFKISNLDNSNVELSFKETFGLEDLSTPYFYIYCKEDLKESDKSLIFLNRNESLREIHTNLSKEQINENYAFYKSTEIFAHNNVVIEVNKKFSHEWKVRLSSQIFITHILEILVIKKLLNLSYSKIIDENLFIDEMTSEENYLAWSETANEIVEFEKSALNITYKTEIDYIFQSEASIKIASNLWTAMDFSTLIRKIERKKDKFNWVKKKHDQILEKEDQKRERAKKKITTIVLAFATVMVSSSFFVDALVNLGNISQRNSFIIFFSIISFTIVSLFSFYLSILFRKRKAKSKLRTEYEEIKKRKAKKIEII